MTKYRSYIPIRDECRGRMCPDLDALGVGWPAEGKAFRVRVRIYGIGTGLPNVRSDP